MTPERARKVKDSIKRLDLYCDACNKGTYAQVSQITDSGLNSSEHVIHSAIAYLARYLNKDTEKGANPQDLLKAAHYILIEHANRQDG